MKRTAISRSVSFIKKNGTYLMYVDFNFILLKRTAAELMDSVLANADSDGWLNLDGIPVDFVDYLLSRKIIEESTT